jgi:hypothetical protein
MWPACFWEAILADSRHRAWAARTARAALRSLLNFIALAAARVAERAYRAPLTAAPAPTTAASEPAAAQAASRQLPVAA